jgi:excisionase family DNA binding protein
VLNGHGKGTLSAIDGTRMGAIPIVDAIARDVAQVVGMPTKTLVALLLKCAAVQSAVSAELARTAAIDPTPETPAGLLTSKQVAKYLQVPESWISSEARAGRIPKRKIGRYIRFDLYAVEQALAQRVE